MYFTSSAPLNERNAAVTNDEQTACRKVIYGRRAIVKYLSNRSGGAGNGAKTL